MQLQPKNTHECVWGPKRLCFLNTAGANILGQVERQEYQEALEDIQGISGLDPNAIQKINTVIANKKLSTQEGRRLKDDWVHNNNLSSSIKEKIRNGVENDEAAGRIKSEIVERIQENPDIYKGVQALRDDIRKRALRNLGLESKENIKTERDRAAFNIFCGAIKTLVYEWVIDNRANINARIAGGNDAHIVQEVEHDKARKENLITELETIWNDRDKYAFLSSLLCSDPKLNIAQHMHTLIESETVSRSTVAHVQETMQLVQAANITDAEGIMNVLEDGDEDMTSALVAIVKHFNEKYNRARASGSLNLSTNQMQKDLGKYNKYTSTMQTLLSDEKMCSVLGMSLEEGMEHIKKYIQNAIAAEGLLHSGSTVAHMLVAMNISDILPQLEKEIEHLERSKKIAEKIHNKKASKQKAEEELEGGAGALSMKQLGEDTHFGEEEWKMDTTFSSIKNTWDDIVTVNGGIEWWSLDQLIKEAQTVFEVYKKHYENLDEERIGGIRGPLLKKIHPQLYRLSRERTVSGLQKMQNELKDLYANRSLENIIKEIKSKHKIAPEIRAGLHSLAERGLLHVSNRELIDAIMARSGRKGISNDEWVSAKSSGNYENIRERVIQAMDAISAEADWGNEIIDMQRGALDKKEKEGEEMMSASEASVIDEEIARIVSICEGAGVDGDARLVGAVAKLCQRGNAFEGNGKKNKIEINGKDSWLPSDFGSAALIVVDNFLKGHVSEHVIGKISKAGEGGFTPLSCMQDMFILKSPTGITKFEEWGWIEEDSKGKKISSLGEKEMRNFFNTRNARAEIETEDEKGNKVVQAKMVNIALDSNVYYRHSSKKQSMSDVKQTDTDDKMMYAVVKNASKELFVAASKKHHGESALSQRDQLASLIKALVQKYQDGVGMLTEEGSRYMDVQSGVELSNEERMQLMATNPERVQSVGELWVSQAGEYLEAMFEQIIEGYEDRAIAEKSVCYQVEGTGQQTLREYLQGAVVAFEASSRKGLTPKGQRLAMQSRERIVKALARLESKELLAQNTKKIREKQKEAGHVH